MPSFQKLKSHESRTRELEGVQKPFGEPPKASHSILSPFAMLFRFLSNRRETRRNEESAFSSLQAHSKREARSIIFSGAPEREMSAPQA